MVVPASEKKKSAKIITGKFSARNRFFSDRYLNDLNIFQINIRRSRGKNEDQAENNTI